MFATFPKGSGLAAMTAVLLPGMALSETRQHRNMIYTLPEGWRAGSTLDNGARILWSDLPDEECEYCRLYLGPQSQIRTGRPELLLARNPRMFLDEDDPDPELVGEATSLRAGTYNVAMQGLKAGRNIQVLIAVELDDRTEFFGFEGKAGDEESTRESLAVFQRDGLPMILATRYLTEGARPVLGAPVPGGIAGVWQGSGVRWSLGLDMMMKMDIDNELFVFWEDGSFYDGSPPAGTMALDRAALLRAGDMSWGNYRIDGDRLFLDYVDGAGDERSLTGGDMDQGFSCISQSTCYPVKPLPDGTKIDGRIENFSYHGFAPGIGMSGGTHFSSTLYYAPDGRWSFSSSGGASVSFDPGGGYASSHGSQSSGRYRVENGTVIRSYDDGSPDVTELIYLDAAGEVMIGSDYLKTGK